MLMNVQEIRLHCVHQRMSHGKIWLCVRTPSISGGGWLRQPGEIRPILQTPPASDGLVGDKSHRPRDTGEEKATASLSRYCVGLFRFTRPEDSLVSPKSKKLLVLPQDSSDPRGSAHNLDQRICIWWIGRLSDMNWPPRDPAAVTRHILTVHSLLVCLKEALL